MYVYPKKIRSFYIDQISVKSSTGPIMIDVAKVYNNIPINTALAKKFCCDVTGIHPSAPDTLYTIVFDRIDKWHFKTKAARDEEYQRLLLIMGLIPN